MEVLAALAALVQTAARGELLTLPIPATGLLTTLTILTLEVRGREVSRARIVREARRVWGATRELAEKILDASIRQEELSAEVQMGNPEPTA
jgi:hypothetical protein